MAMFVLLFMLLKIAYLYGSQSFQDVKLEIFPFVMSPISLKVDDRLNLTCKILGDTRNDIHLEWDQPIKALNRQNKIDTLRGNNYVNMVIQHIEENDAGEYRCTASSNTNPDLIVEKSIRINVKLKKKCTEPFFSCLPAVCIKKLYLCDGRRDCKNGEDEAEHLCGVKPCQGKIRCSNGRCIPSSWCCDAHQDPNCTTRVWNSCCDYPVVSFPEDSGYNMHETRYKDVAFFQTTVYTVIGCAMAFMFIITILVIAICRVHMRRNTLPRCGTVARPMNNCRTNNHYNGLPFYDLDVLFNRSNDVMAVNPLLVTYNINNGVQFVGRPVDPPPYCEVVATPPREGPPPPYASHENLNNQSSSSRKDSTAREPDESRESDSLLGHQQQQMQTISVISRNSIDGDASTSQHSTTYVVNLTDDNTGGSPMLTVVETVTTDDGAHFLGGEGGSTSGESRN